MPPICVQCGHHQKETSLVSEQKEIRLNHCEKCEKIIDPYLEYELMIITLDLLLQKTKAYRHVIFNFLNGNLFQNNNNLLRLALLSILLKTYLKFILLNQHDIQCSAYDLTTTISNTVIPEDKLVGLDFLENAFVFYFTFCIMTLDLLVLIIGVLFGSFCFTLCESWKFKYLTIGVLLSTFTEIFRAPLIIWKSEIQLSPLITFSITLYHFISVICICRVILYKEEENIKFYYNTRLWCISFLITAFSFIVKWLICSIIITKTIYYFCGIDLHLFQDHTITVLLHFLQHLAFWK
ncbi:hypothetical protein ABK040_013396 [Willaertia magna]